MALTKRNLTSLTAILGQKYQMSRMRNIKDNTLALKIYIWILAPFLRLLFNFQFFSLSHFHQTATETHA